MVAHSGERANGAGVGAGALGTLCGIERPPSTLKRPEKAGLGLLERYMLQSVARDTLYGKVPFDRTAPWHRLVGCHRLMVDRQVQLLRDPRRDRGYYRGLQTDGSAWVCPVCSGAIYDGRRHEVKAILDGARAGGLVVQFVTFTLSHHWEPLSQLMAGLTEATRQVHMGGAWRRYRDSLGYVGSIRGREVTIGANGFHPHVHVCWLTERGSARDTRVFLVPRYRAALAQLGLSASVARGVTVKEWSLSHDDYIAKFDKPARAWDFDAELTMWARKVNPGARGLSPWDLLRGILESDQPAHVADLRGWFTEYAWATKGLHSLQFSKGLRARFGVVERSDEEIAAAGTVATPLAVLGALEHADWRIVRANDAIGELRVLVGRGDPVQLVAFLRSLGVSRDVLFGDLSGGCGDGD